MPNRSLKTVVTRQTANQVHVFGRGTAHERTVNVAIKLGGVVNTSKKYALKGSKAGVSAGVNFGKPIVFGVKGAGV